jgi:hypothetical protein
MCLHERTGAWTGWERGSVWARVRVRVWVRGRICVVRDYVGRVGERERKGGGM